MPRRPLLALVLLAACGAPAAKGGGDGGSAGDGGSTGGGHVKTVFLVLLENENWSDVHGSADAPYLNGTLLPMGAHAEQYFNPPGNHPSEPNYLWLEGGTNFGVHDDYDPSVNHQASTRHLAHLLDQAGVSWRAYEEDVSGTDCPLTATGGYRPKHDPFVFFDDLTGGLDPHDAGCIAHNRPLSELAGDLAPGGKGVARYDFITPNLCHDGHDKCPPLYNHTKQIDQWLASAMPAILDSRAFSDDGLVLITWDESEDGDYPIGMIALGPRAKKGYASNVHLTHSSTLRTLEEIFGVSPLLGDAANAPDLGDLFTTPP